MIREEFLRLAAAGYNRIPLARETLADFDTPLSIYLKLAAQPNSYLLESVQGGEKWGRYSIIGLPCRTVLRVHEHQISVTHDGVEIEAHESEDPLAFVETFKARYNVPTIAGLPRFNGGLVGYFGYDCVRYVEKRLGKCPNPDPLGVPDILLMVSDAVVVFDNLAGKMHAIVLVDPAQPDAYEEGQARLEALLEQLRQPMAPRRGLDFTQQQAADPVFRSSFTQNDYEKAVDTIKDYILAGDCMQVVPSQRMSIDFKAAPIDLYRALRCFNPTPYMYFFNFGDFHVAGSLGARTTASTLSAPTTTTDDAGCSSTTSLPCRYVSCTVAACRGRPQCRPVSRRQDPVADDGSRPGGACPSGCPPRASGSPARRARTGRRAARTRR